MPSFDAVSEVNTQEIDNAINQTKKEIQNRYDFKGSKTDVEFKDDSILLIADDEMKLKALTLILNEKLAKRGISLNSLDFQKAEGASGGSQRQKVLLKQGIAQDDAKKIVKLIKDKKLKKIQAQIQGDQVRITGPKKDDLQEVMALLKEKIELPLQYKNFKD